MEEQHKTLHPFFTADRVNAPSTPHAHDTSASDSTGAIIGSAPAVYPQQPTAEPGDHQRDPPKKRRKTDAAEEDGVNDTERRVRRKATPSPDSTSIAQITPNNQGGATPLVAPNAPSLGGPPPANAPLPESDARPYIAPQESTTQQPDSTTDCGKAKKLIKFNPKTGTLGSPPRPKAPTKTSSSKASLKGRKSFLVCIKYGGNDPAARERMGQHIRQMLERNQTQIGPGTPNASTQPTANTSKPPHPFFSKKSKKSPSGAAPSTPQAGADRPKPSRQVVFSSTPCSPKRSRVSAPSHGLQFGIKSTGLKVPGATLPLWPPQDMGHVRSPEHGSVNGPPLPGHPLPQRKAKGHSVEIADEESILTSLTRSTDVAAVAASIQSDLDNADKVLPPPKELRLPQKHFESGTKVQRRMRSRLKTYRPALHDSDSSEDELALQAHPFIKRLYNTLGTSLSAYDRSTCENTCWAQKYAPQSTAEILQPGREGSLLREWLLRLKIDSVDTGAESTTREKPAVDAKTRGRKKRKKPLEGFIVDSDDEADDLYEVSDGDETWASPADKDSLRSVIRHGDVKAKATDGRLTNAVVISGPHGCGKTAAVYAIAKELDFEVFEINASSRRSGKDVLERVGDMTRNHLVHHRVDEVQDEDRTAEDVKSGKQGTVTSFFKPNSGGKAQQKKPASPKASPNASHGAKHQKQSLILLEEVDVLYEEDKQFWATITTLMAQSKRPFVMTCNDEALVPLQALSLHGIFRFSAPPADLAVDAILLAAAGEGHVLERGPVEELYETRGRDLRASLAELNYWCQIGVGDRRGGMDWFYLRWPAGSDRDERGDVVRVISEATYQSGMGWFGDAARGGQEEELVHESWEGWGADCDALLMGPPRGSVAEWSDLIDAMSSADLLSCGAFGQRFEERLDATLPETGPQARDDYVLGRRLLDTPQLTSYSSLASTASTAIKCLARRRLARPITERDAIANVRKSLTAPRALARLDMSLAFDPIAASDKAPAGHLDPSVFDRTMRLIVLDVAPFVRGIVATDERRRMERVRSGLVSEGGKRRKTRAALSAVEGGERRVTRERWFSDEVNGVLVRRTGGDWQGAVEGVIGGQGIVDGQAS